MNATTTGTMRALDSRTGAVRVEDVYDTSIDDLWDACTRPERLARWIAEVSGDLRVGGTVQVTFTSTADGPARIDVCDAPHHLLITMEPGTEEEGPIEAWLTEEGDRTRLAVEKRGLPADKLHFYAAGWQTHLEDLGRALSTGTSAHPDGWSAEQPSPAFDTRWTELIPVYEAMPVADR